jgi:hypothetical protein
MASGPWSFIGGGGRDGIEAIPAGTHERDNVATHKWTVVVGGFGNVAAAERATVGGGSQNGAGGIAATVAGGAFNTATANWSTVAGGSDNQATNQSATVAGGQLNTASGFVATVAGGFLNEAIGQFSFAAGLRAIAAGDGTFAIADSSSDNLDWPVAVANSFGARYTGGFTFATAVDPATGLYQKGCQLFGNSGTFSCTSDRATKTAFTPIDVRAILRDVVTLPITAWRFDGEPVAVRHIGPTSQDFYAAFGLSHDDKSISMLDGQGVALAAIQGLNAKLETALVERDATIAAQSREIAELRRAVDVLLARTSPDNRVTASR